MKKVYPLLVLWMCVSMSYAQIIPTEIMYNPPESGQDSLEYLELYNNSFLDVNLNGYTFQDGITLTFGDVTIPSGSYLLIAKNDTALARTLGVTPDVEWESGSLSNGGESIILLDDMGNTVFSVTYDDTDPWPSEPDAGGPSLELCDLAADYTDPASWGAASTATGVSIDGTEIFGTPGSPNNTECGLSFDHRVEVSSNQFTPEDLTINIGETVLWENVEGEHNVDGRQQTYPNNPQGFYSGPSTSDPWQFTHTFTQEGFYQYECTPHADLGMTGTVTVVNPFQLPKYDIFVVTTNDMNGVPDSLGVDCKLEGVIHGANRREGGYEVSIIDDSGDGITIFANDNIGGYVAQQGDRVEVEGQIGQFNGLTQIYVDNITLISMNNPLQNARVITELNEDTESEYVMFENVEFLNPAAWEGNGNSFNMELRQLDNDEVFTIRIDNASPLSMLSEPPLGADGSPFSIRGMGAQFDRDEPYFEGYQLFPGFETDFMPVSNVGRVYELDAMIYPNPVQNILKVRDMELGADRVEIIDQNGKQLISLSNVNEQISIPVGQLSSATYFLVVHKDGDLYYKQFIKQ